MFRKAVLYDLGFKSSAVLAFIVNSFVIYRHSLFGHASEISAFSQMYNALQGSTIAELYCSTLIKPLFAGFM